MSEYITRVTMKHDYNMTDALIKKLGEPDKITTNPHYRSGPPMQLYLRERVEKWVEENPELIQKVIDRRKKRPLKPIEDDATKFKKAVTKDFRITIRQVGEKWSWSVYRKSDRKMIKTGWSDNQEDAEEKSDRAMIDAVFDSMKIKDEDDYRY